MNDNEYAKLIKERDDLQKRLNAANMELRGYDRLRKDLNNNSDIRRLEFSVKTARSKKCFRFNRIVFKILEGG